MRGPPRRPGKSALHRRAENEDETETPANANTTRVVSKLADGATIGMGLAAESEESGTRDWFSSESSAEAERAAADEGLIGRAAVGRGKGEPTG